MTPIVDAGARPLLDITGERCPMTFVRLRLALDRMAPGDVLAVRLAGEEPRLRVPQTLREQGHTVLEQADGADGVMTLTVRKAMPSR